MGMFESFKYARNEDKAVDEEELKHPAHQDAKPPTAARTSLAAVVKDPSHGVTACTFEPPNQGVGKAERSI